METLKNAVLWIIANYQLIITAIAAVVSALIALFLLIPGEQPEKALRKIADFLAKFSNKSK